MPSMVKECWITGIPVYMAPLHKAVHVEPSASTNVYRGTIDSDWAIGPTPHGGYLLALILQACIIYQSSTAHPDPIHLTAHFLKASSIMPFEIRLRPLKEGRAFTNILAELVQEGKTRVTSHLIFGILSSSPSKDSPPEYVLTPPSPYARRLPLTGHPSTAVTTSTAFLTSWGFRDHYKWAWDPILMARNSPDSPTRTNESTAGGGGAEWGAWFELTDTEERITTPSLAVLVDIFMSGYNLLPSSEKGKLSFSWFPTITLSLEFKFPIPSSRDISTRTVGIYSRSRFITGPQGRHENQVEVWTSPSNIGEGREEPRWREKQVCLAVATQMNLVIPRAWPANGQRAQTDVKL